MGDMVEGLFRVHDEILRLRRERELLLASREEETRERRAAVSRMLARFSRDLAEAAGRGRIRRMDFLADLRREVLRLLDGLEADCGGAREALVRLTGARGGPAPRIRMRRNSATDGAAAPAQRPPKVKVTAERQEAKSQQHETGRQREKARRRPRR
ncbi:MAG: hypothetical protein WCC59_08555 [Terriglobales bacterium]